MFATIAALAAKADLIWGLELLIGRLTEATMIESGGWARGDPKLTANHIQLRLANASKTEFPTLTQAPHTLGAKLIRRSKPDYLQERADAAVCGVGRGSGGERLLAKSMSATSRSRRGPHRPTIYSIRR